MDHFDLIVGTSTGGIIAIGLGLGLSPRKIVEFYVDHGPSIFGNSLRRRALSFFCHKYCPRALETSLRGVGAFGERTLGESRKRLVIPSYNLGADDVYIFKTPHQERLRRDWKVPAWKVAMATAAAPTYFPSFRGIDNIRLIDGGLWANNPTMVGVLEAHSVLNVALSDTRVLSIGTTDPIVHRPRALDRGGLWQWRQAAIDVLMRGQSIGAHKQALHLLGSGAVHRLDPRAPDGIYALDRVTADELIAHAAHESRVFSPTFKDHFASHTASPYAPLYPSFAQEPQAP